MIRINLNSNRVSGMSGNRDGIQFQVDEEGGGSGLSPAENQKQGIIRLVVILIFPLVIWGYQETTIPGLIAEKNAENSKLLELQDYNTKMEKSVLEIKKFKADEERIQSRIAYLEKLGKDRVREIKVLDLIQKTIPEKVWLTKVESLGGRMSIAGLAMSDFDISAFMESLAKSVFFVDVNLANSMETTFEGLPVKSFEIVCLTEKPGP